MSARPALALLLAGALASGGCAINPVSRQPEISFMSTERENALGRQAAQEVEQSIGLVKDPGLTRYVDALGQRLAQHSPRRDVSYRFHVADMPEPNAFALPGGYIYVSRGLLAIANSEAELANVIGHEIGHVAARHASQRETRSVGVGVLSTLGAVVAGVAAGGQAAQAVSQLGQLAGAGLIASYGRDQERQADEVGQQLAAESGWSPGAVSSFFVTLERQTKLDHGERLPSFLDSHPMTSERAQTTAARARTLAVTRAPGVPAAQRAFLHELENLLIGPDPGQGVLRGRRFLHPGLDLALDFPSGWEVQNTASAVGAVSPQRDALVMLEMQGPAGDPQAAGAKFAQANRLALQNGSRERLGGIEAYHALAVVNTQDGPLVLDLTWLAQSKAVLRLTGMSPQSRYQGQAATLAAVPLSVGELSAAERGGIKERRLRVVEARAGENLGSLSARTGNVWSLEETSIANGLTSEPRLEAGQLVKVAVEVPYR
ncbi:MAG: M48 family metalloprotease [Candidatus Limnocylindria bacterium]